MRPREQLIHNLTSTLGGEWTLSKSAPGNNTGWQDRMTPDQKEWWDEVVALVKERGQLPSMERVRLSWTDEGWNYNHLPSDPTLRATFRKAINEVTS